MMAHIGIHQNDEITSGVLDSMLIRTSCTSYRLYQSAKLSATANAVAVLSHSYLTQASPCVVEEQSWIRHRFVEVPVQPCGGQTH
jgi:hypothetical protein